MQWFNEDGTVYDTTTCNAGDDVVLPTAPTKRGYTFMGWTGYTPIEYLESTGTQIIDTGYTFDLNVKVVFKASWPQVSGLVFGANSNSVAEEMLNAGSGYLNGQSFSFSPALQTNTDYIIEMQMYKGDGYLKINDVIKASNNYTGKNASNRIIWLFGVINNGDSTDVTKRSMKIYYFKIYKKDSNNNEILVCDLIPVIDNNGIPYMFDKVTNQIFYNAGTGDFIAGPVISQ